MLTRISHAHPKIAPYPFTTLTPQIGVVELPAYQRVTVADIPGLIEGAHANVGLGHGFLRHIVRCKLLVFVIDMAGSEGREPIADLQTLRRLDLYDAQLSTRPWLVVANKMDLQGRNLEAFRARFQNRAISANTATESKGSMRARPSTAHAAATVATNGPQDTVAQLTRRPSRPQNVNSAPPASC